MTQREEIAQIYGQLGDLYHRLAVLCQEATSPPGGKIPATSPRPRPPAAPRAHQPDDEPRDVNAGDVPAMDGRDYYGYIKGDPGKLKRVQGIGKSLGIGWQVTGWTISQVAQVDQLLRSKMPADGARRAVR